jgi:type IV pilus assembly protein PilX
VKTSKHTGSPQPFPQHQRGLSLIFALLSLAALMLAAVALVRSVDTNAQVLGNLGFKQDTMLASDDAARRAIDWLAARRAGATLHAAVAGGYYPTNFAAIDVTGRRTTDAARVVVDWDDDNCARYTLRSGCLEPSGELPLANGVRGQFLISRLCAASGDPKGAINCAASLGLDASESGAHGSPCYGSSCGGVAGTAGQGVYYRIVVRTVGARNTVTFTETIVQL